MTRTRLRVVFFGEPASTFSRLHLAVLRQSTDVVLWVHSPRAGHAMPRSGFRSPRDLVSRLAVRAALEAHAMRCLGRPAAMLGEPAGPVYAAARRDPHLAARVAAAAPDLLISAAFGQILPTAVLATARLGGFNCHPSPLPRYAGSNPWFWILKGGETQSAVTVHRMVDI
ncbi:MAG TPA: formyltransferase family protein, partial [Chloroflexia bacterium]|nr:formyltransferase family protein [Chloroflexia bacterium]